MVTGASAGPMTGELPIGTSVLCSSACAIPHSSRTAIQIIIFFSMADKRGDTAVSPHLLNIIGNVGFIGARYKYQNPGWLSKKFHMRSVRFFYHFGVLKYVVMIEKLYPKGTS